MSSGTAFETYDWHIGEHFLKGKTSETANEDRIVITPYYIGVIDGATSKSDFRPAGQTTGQWAARLVEAAIRTLPPTAPWSAVTSHITCRLQRFYAENGLTDTVRQHPEQRLTASCALYSRHLQAVALIGDCQCLVGEKNFSNGKKIDGLLAAARAAWNEAALLQGKSVAELLENDEGRAFIRPFLVKQSVFQNLPAAGHPYAYGVFDGFPLPAGQVRVIPVLPQTPVVLATDGYPQLFPTLRQSEDHLAGLLQKDPLCIRSYQSTKGMYKGQCSFDDRAFISFSSF